MWIAGHVSYKDTSDNKEELKILLNIGLKKIKICQIEKAVDNFSFPLC